MLYFNPSFLQYKGTAVFWVLEEIAFSQKLLLFCGSGSVIFLP